VTIGSTSTEIVSVDYTTNQNATVKKLVSGEEGKRVCTSTKVEGKTLTWTNVSYRMVKEAKETVA